MQKYFLIHKLLPILFFFLISLISHSGFAQTSTPNTNFPVTNGPVNAIAVDGSGTIYIGGSFTTVGGVARNRIAAISSTGTVTSWDPNANGTVRSLAVSGSTLYVGGTFSVIGGQARAGAAALDTSTGLANAWNPSPGNAVRAIAISGSTIYVGGDFTSIGGQPRNRIAALNNTNGNATAWNPAANNGVASLVISGTTIYVGGDFTVIGGDLRNRIAAITDSGTLTAWDPNANNSVNSMVLSGSTMYVAGFFTNIGGQNRNRIAALNTAVNTNNATDWNPDANDSLFAVTLNGSTVYAGGKFGVIGGQSRNQIASLNAAVNTNNATTWNPNAQGGTDGVKTILVNGSSIYIGGEFTTIGGNSREGFAVFDQPTVSLSASPLSISESGGTSTVTTTLSGASSQDVTVNLSFAGTAVLGTNYTRSGTSITILAGATTGTVTITGVNDGQFNAGFTVIPTISSVTNGTAGTPSSATITLTNANPAPTITLSASPTSIATNGGTSTLTATLDATSGVDTVANITYTGDAVRNTNYTAPNTITITAGSLTGTGTITRSTAPTVGPDLSVISTITSVDNSYATIGSPSSATVNLTNTTPSLSINNATALEDAGTMTFTVTLSQASAGTVTVDYATANGTALAGVNYVATSGTLTFTAGQTTKTIEVQILNTSFGTGNTKTFTVTLSNPSGATISSATGTGTIQGVNPSGPPVSIEVVGGNNVTVGADGAILTLVGSTTLTTPLYNWEILSGGVGFLTNADQQTAFYHIPAYPPTATVTIRLTVTGTSASIGAKFDAEAPLFQTVSDSSATEINISGTGPVGGGGCGMIQSKNNFSNYSLLLIGFFWILINVKGRFYFSKITKSSR